MLAAGGPRRDVAPVADRMTAFMAFRVVAAGLLAVLGEISGVPATSMFLTLTAGYLGLGAGLTLLSHTSWRWVRAGAFAAGLLVDGLYLQYQHTRLGAEVPVDLAIAAFLVAACLLASFRTGLRVALVQSLLLILSLRGQDTGLIPVAPGGTPDNAALAAELGTLWLVILTTATAVSVHERELRRRRYDAEALQHFAATLHHDTTAEAVAERILRFGTEDLLGRRGAVVRQHRRALELVAGQGTARPPHVADGEVSSVLALAALSRDPTLVLRLDPLRDGWLDALLPSARRVVVVRLDVGLDERMWLVLEHRSRRGRRVERRFVAALSQAASTASLALDRVRLLSEATLRASQDALTGVPNRRSLDDLLERLTAAHQRSGAGFSVVMVDVDRFKMINDTLGHQAGDEVLQQVAATLAGQLRKNETIARYGGEEFAVVLPGAGTRAAVAVAERLRVALHGITGPVSVTASFGVASVPEDASDGVGATALADAALMRAKQDGRDRVAAAGFADSSDRRPAAPPAPRDGRVPAADNGEGSGTFVAEPDPRPGDAPGPLRWPTR